MGFIKKIWKDRISEFPTRRSLTKTDGTSELVTVARSEGMILEEGDAFSAENMNDFENRVANGFSELNENITFPDGSGFYPDVQDGVRGYNTDPGRGADTFVPFKKSPILIGSRSGNGTINCTSINGYEKLSANDFLISITKYNTSVTGGGNMPSGKSFSVIPNKSYNPSTGILTLSGCAGSIYDHPATMATTLTVDIYLK